jgi:transposase
MPYARASQFLHDLLGVQLSAGSIATFVETCHQQLAGVETDLKAALVKANVIHQDETGVRVDKAGWWVHVCSTDRLTYYAAHPSRGRSGLDAIGIAPQFQGISVHDAYSSYQGYASTPALCNVHHLRDLTFIEEELQQPWARKMKDLLVNALPSGSGSLLILLANPCQVVKRLDEVIARKASVSFEHEARHRASVSTERYS